MGELSVEVGPTDRVLLDDMTFVEVAASHVTPISAAWRAMVSNF